MHVLYGKLRHGVSQYFPLKVAPLMISTQWAAGQAKLVIESRTGMREIRTPAPLAAEIAGYRNELNRFGILLLNIVLNAFWTTKGLSCQMSFGLVYRLKR